MTKKASSVLLENCPRWKCGHSSTTDIFHPHDVHGGKATGPAVGLLCRLFCQLFCPAHWLFTAQPNTGIVDPGVEAIAGSTPTQPGLLLPSPTQFQSLPASPHAQWILLPVGTAGAPAGCTNCTEPGVTSFLCIINVLSGMFRTPRTGVTHTHPTLWPIGLGPSSFMFFTDQNRFSS